MSAASRPSDALAPFAYIINVLTTLLGLLFGLMLLLAPTGHTSVGNLSARSVCTTVPAGELYDAWGEQAISHLSSTLTRGGVQAEASAVQLCAGQPSLGLRIVSDGGTDASLAFAVTFLVLCNLLLRRARREGLYTKGVAHGVIVLGLVVLLGAVATWLVSSLCAGLTHHYLLYGGSWHWDFDPVHLSIATVIAGFGIVTVGRVMAIGVRMQHEIDATI